MLANIPDKKLLKPALLEDKPLEASQKP